MDHSLTVAALVRAVTQTCDAEVADDAPVCDPRPELLREATWRAAHYGLDGELIDVYDQQSLPAVKLVESLLSYLRPVLEDNGEWSDVCSLVEDVIDRGPGAARQREAFRRAERVEDVVDLVVQETKSGVV